MHENQHFWSLCQAASFRIVSFQNPNRNPAQHPQGVRRIRKAAKPPTAAQRIAVGKEEQRHERALAFEKSRSKRYRACSDVVPVVGLEPTRYRYQRILSPSRLPIPSHRHLLSAYYTGSLRKIQEWISDGEEK